MNWLYKFLTKPSDIIMPIKTHRDWTTVRMYADTRDRLVHFSQSNNLTLPDGLDQLMDTVIEQAEEIKKLKRRLHDAKL